MMQGTKKQFWMVLGLGTPTYRHDSPDKARAEAERLARECPGQEFVVLESICSVVKSDVAWFHHDPDSGNEVPF